VIELFGLGLASAVLLDALIVRSVLVPALMLAIGKRNWDLPAKLDRILPHLNVEGTVPADDLKVTGDSRSGERVPSIGAIDSLDTPTPKAA